MALFVIKDQSTVFEHLPVSSSVSSSANIEKSCNQILEKASTTILPVKDGVDKADLFVPAVKPSAFVKVNLGKPEYEAHYAQVLADVMSMTKGQLQIRYQAEYNSLRSRKEKAKQRHIKFFDSLKDIRDWLIHLGPRPAKGWTVDRIKGGKGYQPGNLRWATKIQQTHNRKVTRWHQLPSGDRLTTQQLADRLGLPYQTLYKRLRTGWTVDRLLQNEKPATLASWKFPPEFAQHCQPLYQQRKNFTQHRIDWFIDYLADVMYNKWEGKWDVVGIAVSSLLKYLGQAREDRENILQLQSELEEEKLKQLMIILDPPPELTDSLPSDSMTDEAYKECIKKYSDLL
jgi:hypothetical protein